MHPYHQARRRVQRTCGVKHRFGCELEALVHAAWRSGGGVPLRIYSCHHCGGWHLTSKPLTQPGGVP